jgi:GT2 family glycosyltransferase
VAGETPPEVRAQLERRRAARAARDYALADQIRAELEASGWQVVDGPEGSRAEPAGRQPEAYPNATAVPSLLDQPDECEYSLCLAVYGWAEDVRRLVAVTAASATEVVAVDVSGSGLSPEDLTPAEQPNAARAVRVIRVQDALGHAQAWNTAARRARGRIIFFLEPSLEFGPSVLDTLAAALDDDAVGMVGPFGLGTDDMRSFEPDSGPDVAALEYLLAIRRERLAAVGELDPHYRFYRNLDIDFSYQVRAAGLLVRRVECEGIVQHEHRLWESTTPEERERLSRKNFNRFLDRWGRG